MENLSQLHAVQVVKLSSLCFKIGTVTYRVNYEYFFTPDRSFKCRGEKQCGEPVHEVYIRKLVRIRLIQREGDRKTNHAENETIHMFVINELNNCFLQEQKRSILAPYCKKHLTDYHVAHPVAR